MLDTIYGSVYSNGMNTTKYQVQMQWADHSKGPDFWQTMNGVYKSRETAQAAIDKAERLQPGKYTSRIIEK